MKKRLLVVFLLLNSIFFFSQKNNDTIFLEKNKNQKIYLEKNRNSKYYKDILNFSDFKKLKSSKIESIGLISEWSRVYKYDNTYVSYAPCDWCNQLQLKISDNYIQFNACEKTTYKIISIKKISFGVYKIVYLIYPKEQKFLYIKYLNNSGVAKVMFENEKNKNEVYLMLNIKKIKEYDIIVNECSEKTKEFEFEK